MTRSSGLDLCLYDLHLHPDLVSSDRLCPVTLTSCAVTLTSCRSAFVLVGINIYLSCLLGLVSSCNRKPKKWWKCFSWMSFFFEIRRPEMGTRDLLGPEVVHWKFSRLLIPWIPSKHSFVLSQKFSRSKKIFYGKKLSRVLTMVALNNVRAIFWSFSGIFRIRCVYQVYSNENRLL